MSSETKPSLIRRPSVVALLALFAIEGASAYRLRHGRRHPGVRKPGAAVTAVAAVADEGPLVATTRPLPLSSDLHLGRRVADLAFVDVGGTRGSLSGYAERKALVVAMRDTRCPVSSKYAPRLGELSRQWHDRGVDFLFIGVAEGDTAADLEAEAARNRFVGRVVVDRDRAFVDELGATSTAEVFVLDSRMTLRYRGAIDDQYGLDHALAEPRERHLVAALREVVAGQAVSFPAFNAPGCVIASRAAPAAAAPGTPTYHERISRIVQVHCQRCHSEGGIGPFPLDSYDAVRARRAMVRAVVREGRMPKWDASPDSGPWQNDTRLPAADRTAILSWIEAGCPEGDPRNAPETVRFDGPVLRDRKPDAILAVKTPIAVPAEGRIEYQYAYLKTDFPDDRWVEAVELRTRVPAVMHHAMLFVESPLPQSSPRQVRRAVQLGTTGFFAVRTPNDDGQSFPHGTAKRLRKGDWLKLQLHYQPNGRAVEDLPEVALFFRSSPPRREIVTSAIANVRFEIPPGAANHAVSARTVFDEPATLASLLAHMHLRGKSFVYELVLPDGQRRELLRIPRYEFDWQIHYDWSEPVAIPAGAAIEVTGWFDNSQANPRNPDPTVPVRFGQQSDEEMMIGYVDWYR